MNFVIQHLQMDINLLKKVFPNLEKDLYEEMARYATIREVKAGDILLRVGQPIRSTMLILEGIMFIESLPFIFCSSKLKLSV